MKPKRARVDNFLRVEYKKQDLLGQVGSGCPAERPGVVRQDWMPIDSFAQIWENFRSLQ